MNHQGPLVSVIIPVYNGEKYLAEAIESILAQTYKHYETIVVDDGSTDDTPNIIARYRGALHCIAQANAGTSAALNKGLSQAKGEWIAFLDADDLWVEDKLARQVAVIEKDPQIEIVFGFVQQFFSPELDEAIRRKIYCPPDPVPGYVKQAMLAHRKVFDIVGLFDENLMVGDFIDWYARAVEAKVNVYMLPAVVTKRRLHDSHTTDRSVEGKKAYTRILKAKLDRKRSSQNTT